MSSLIYSIEEPVVLYPYVCSAEGANVRATLDAASGLPQDIGMKRGGLGRVLVAMSGGVDSSVAAALLHEQGVELVGVTLHLWNAEPGRQPGRCCAPEDQEDARKTCDALGIPHYVIDETQAFRSQVVDPFLQSYTDGTTPVPCVACNQHVKLTRLLEVASAFGASHVATGHYVRLAHDAANEPTVLRGVDRAKDQSYFLFGVPRETFKRFLFPLGAMNKAQTREAARRLGVPNADKPDSQSLCFVPDGDISSFVTRQAGQQSAGRIVDEQGEVIGTHDGIHQFTVGQRRGLGLPGGSAKYVLRILPQQRDIVVGSRGALASRRLTATRVSWLQPRPNEAFDALVRIRYRHEPSPARVMPTDTGFTVQFLSDQDAITPGQAAVIYQQETLVAGGYIE